VLDRHPDGVVKPDVRGVCAFELLAVQRWRVTTAWHWAHLDLQYWHQAGLLCFGLSYAVHCERGIVSLYVALEAL
jgi:hypothetical protein